MPAFLEEFQERLAQLVAGHAFHVSDEFARWGGLLQVLERKAVVYRELQGCTIGPNS